MRKELVSIAAGAGCVAMLSLFLSAGGDASLRDAARWINAQAQTAAIFFITSITSTEIQQHYVAKPVTDAVTGTPVQTVAPTPKKVKILIVPGHRPSAGGTAFDGVYERNVVVDIADALATLLEQNPHYDVMVARTKTGWNPVLLNYFDTHAADIEAFREKQIADMEAHLADGSILPAEDQVYHNPTPSLATLQLYGINKWASENGYDIVLHIHINDEAGHRSWAPGEDSGYAVYVPDHQYSNAAASADIGRAIAKRLDLFHARSTLPKEDSGVVEDQQLIAIGSNNSADSAALLIEYGYIYEPQFQLASIRQLAIADYAYQTYLGLQDFFGDPVPTTFGSVSFPYDWDTVTAKKGDKGPGIYALQAALHTLGFYPAAGKSFSDCPISGIAGACTKAAIQGYQEAHNIETTGTLGPKTRAQLTTDIARPILSRATP